MSNIHRPDFIHSRKHASPDADQHFALNKSLRLGGQLVTFGHQPLGQIRRQGPLAQLMQRRRKPQVLDPRKPGGRSS